MKKNLLFPFLCLITYACHQGQKNDFSQKEKNDFEKNKVTQLILSAKNNPSSPDAIKKINIALLLCNKKHWEYLEAETMLYKAELFCEKNEFDSAFASIAKAQNVMDQLKFPDLAVRSLILSGNLYFKMDQWDYAQLSYYKALVLSKKTANIDLFAQIIYLISTTYYYQEDFYKADFLNKIALNISTKTGNKKTLARILLGMGALESRVNHPEKAIKYLKMSMALSEESDFTEMMGKASYNLGSSYRLINDFENSEQSYQQALSIFTQNHDTTMLGMTHIGFANVLLANNQQDEAKVHLDAALNLASLSNSYWVRYEANRFASYFYEVSNHFEKAYFYLSRTLSIADSVKTSNIKYGNIAIEKYYEEELKKVKKDSVIFKLQQSKKYMLFVLVVIAFVLVLIVLFFKARHKLAERKSLLENQRLLNEIEFKNKELTIHVLNSVKSNEFINELIDSLDEVEQYLNEDEPILKVKDLKSKIKDKMDKEVWIEFEKRFKDVHNDFYVRLNEKYPSLTPNEKKLCAFLRLNLTSKQIGDLTGQKITAIELARHRLRKKMNICDMKISLVQFIEMI